MTDFRITKTGEYRTKDGRKAVVLCTDAPCDAFPVVGYYVNKNGLKTSSDSWMNNGKAFEGSDEDKDDIISEWKEPEVYEYWRPYYKVEVNLSLDDMKIMYPLADAYTKTRLTINSDGTKDIEIVEKVWR